MSEPRQFSRCTHAAIRVEVRCCCQPQKLLGWLEVPSPKVHEGQWVTFLVASAWPRSLTGPSPNPATPMLNTLSLQIAEYVIGDQRGLAFKSEETPLTVLRQIRGFVEAKPEPRMWPDV